MKITKHLLFAFCAVLLCGGCSDEQASSPQVVPAAKLVPAKETYFGTYTGTLPGADCTGIETTLTLSEDSTFHLRLDGRLYSAMGAAGELFAVRRGLFERMENDTLLAVQSENGHRQYYRIEQGSLRHLDGDKNVITGAIADRYILTKKNR